MRDIKYLNRLFKEYYKKRTGDLHLIKDFNQREFGFIPWDLKTRMIRHMGFASKENFIKYLLNNGPRHVYSSGALYSQPENQDMEGKGYQGCDFIVDIDVDHFYTPCKDDHDFWYCKECGKSDVGMINKCPKCGKSKIKKLTWICDECLEISKKEIIKLIYDFLIPDFDIKLENLSIAFSGHRGYHLKIIDEKLRILSSDERREIADYISGENLSFEILGLQEKGGNIYGFPMANIGWAQKILRYIKKILNKSDIEIKEFLSDKTKFNLSEFRINSFLKAKDNFQSVINSPDKNIWAIEGFGINTWDNFLTGIARQAGVEIDTPVTIDIHRLIRYPGSLHGKTGFKVQEIFLDGIDDFNPLDEPNERLDPVVFESKVKTIQKLEVN